jgi:hypothetical protein
VFVSTYKICIAHSFNDNDVFVICSIISLIGPQVLRFLISDEPNTSTELDLGRPTPALTVGMRNLLLTTTGTGQTRKVSFF